jgi:hypothetical protein
VQHRCEFIERVARCEASNLQSVQELLQLLRIGARRVMRLQRKSYQKCIGTWWRGVKILSMSQVRDEAFGSCRA